jgi:hypothetical protein
MDKRGLPKKGTKPTTMAQGSTSTPTGGKSAPPPAQQSPDRSSPKTVKEAVDTKAKQLGKIKRGQECTQELDVLMDQLRDLMADNADDLERMELLKQQASTLWDKVRAQLSIKDQEIDGDGGETEGGDDYPICTWLGPAKYWKKRTKE